MMREAAKWKLLSADYLIALQQHEFDAHEHTQRTVICIHGSA